MSSTQWLRALRSAARNSRQGYLTTRTTRSFQRSLQRSFHSSAPRYSPDDNGKAPRDDGRKPEGGNEPKSESVADDTSKEPSAEPSLWEASTVTTGESQGRKKPTAGLRSRVQRNLKSELPAVQIPKSFLRLSIVRHGEARVSLKTRQATESPTKYTLDCRGPAHDMLFHFTAWSPKRVEEAMKKLKRRYDTSPIMNRMEVAGISAYWAVVYKIRRQYGEDAYRKVLDSIPPWNTPDWLQEYQSQSPPVIFEEPYLPILVYAMVKGEIPLTKVALYDPCVIDEILMAVRAEFFIRAPKNSKLTNIRRPITIINVPDCTALSVAEDTLEHVANELGADVLHLHGHDIAYIVGRYIGQDVTRTPGHISNLGYRAAENCGRLKTRPMVEEEHDDSEQNETVYVTVGSEEKGRKDSKRTTTSMDDYFSLNTRGKNDELWEDLKINAALDELIHSADTDAAEQRPLIIHVNDFNALNMDETGATILTKIRKAVDEAWLSGRKIALVGSCSARGAPKSYQTALRNLETSDRVIHLSTVLKLSDCATTLARWEQLDYLRENDENICRMLWSMAESTDATWLHSHRQLGLEIKARHGVSLASMAHCSGSVLPLTEVYRIATTMISLSSMGSYELFTFACFHEAVSRIRNVDEAMEETTAKAGSSIGSKKDAKGDGLAITRRRDPFAENHEEKLMSGMVNAQDLRTTFKDIHAPAETIESIKMLTTLSLVRPEAFSYGVLATDRIPGCLLYGPPGTGKTLLAKAVAKESGANMIEISGASINNMYIGESEKNVRALFRLAKKKEPLVIFIDEADALLGARSGHRQGSRRETINQFLREWDGMDSMKAFIMVATNRPFDLDEAVLRRLPRKLLIDLPREADRAAILRIHLKDEVLDETVSIDEMAKQTPLYSGSDLKNMCVAAAMAAVKEELEASERHTGPDPYKWAERRVLNRRHFDKGLKEIGASASEDMVTLTAIRKFDERYGDRRGRKKRKGIGFEVVPEATDSEQARVRSGR